MKNTNVRTAIAVRKQTQKEIAELRNEIEQYRIDEQNGRILRPKFVVGDTVGVIENVVESIEYTNNEFTYHCRDFEFTDEDISKSVIKTNNDGELVSITHTYGGEALAAMTHEENMEAHGVVNTKKDKVEYTWEYVDNTDIWRHDIFESIKDCIEDAKENYDVAVGSKICVGVASKYVASVDSKLLLGNLVEEAYDEYGDVVENWEPYECCSESDISELSNKLTRIINQFMEKNGTKPTFYSIDDVHDVEVK